MQHGDALGEFEHRVHVVLDQNDGAAFAEVADQLLDALALGRAQARKRLVEQQHRGLRRQREPEFEPALLAIGERIDDEVGASGEIEFFDERATSASTLGKPSAARKMSSRSRPRWRPSAPIRRFCAHGELREQLIDLIALGQAVLIGRGDVGGRDVDAVQQNRAGIDAFPRA